MRALHICYFGLRENLVQTQVLPSLEELARAGHEMSIITFEPDLSTTWSKESIREQQRLLRTRGIDWTPLAYHKRPSLPATLYDVLCGVLFIWRSHRQSPLDLLHARSHIPMIMALLARSLTRSAVIFDIRGLIADEYVDAGIWRQRSIIYRVMKRLEMVGIRRA
ncbi:MAG: glycosyltransferase, partial [Acidobacteriota bacterium]